MIKDSFIVWFRCCLVDSVDEHELKEQNKKSVLGVHPDSCKIKTKRQSIYHLQAVFELLYLQRSLHYVFKWEKRSTYPSPSWNPATTYVFHSGLMLDLRMYITLVNQENRLAGVYTKPSFKHSSSILKHTTKTTFKHSSSILKHTTKTTFKHSSSILKHTKLKTWLQFDTVQWNSTKIPPSGHKKNWCWNGLTCELIIQWNPSKLNLVP